MATQETGFHGPAAARGASFVEYEGYWLPAHFGGDLLDEYWAVRRRVGVIDLSPLRKFDVTGPGAGALLQATMTRDIGRLGDGQVVYTAMCAEDGGLLDDGTVFRFGPARFRWIGYTDDDGPWLREQASRLGLEVAVEPSTDRLHNIAVQGPASREVVRDLVTTDPGLPAVSELTWFRFTAGRLNADAPGAAGTERSGDPGSGPDRAPGPQVLVSRTGYSGELGYELFCRPEDAAAVWEAVFAAGEAHGVHGFGLDALDLLRIEAGLIFKGYEYEQGVQDPFEAGIDFTVPLGKAAEFVGKAALERRRSAPQARLVGLEIAAAEPPAGGDPVRAGDSEVGVVTSPCRSPILDRTIALARVQVAQADPGTSVEVAPAGGEVGIPATVVRFPFYDPDKTRPRS